MFHFIIYHSFFLFHSDYNLNPWTKYVLYFSDFDFEKRNIHDKIKYWEKNTSKLIYSPSTIYVFSRMLSDAGSPKIDL